MKEVRGSFAWDPTKEELNIRKHGIDFTTAASAFEDTERKIYVDSKHSEREPRFFCVGRVGEDILTVRFTYRDGIIRIFGAGRWRKGARHYEKEDV